MQSHVLGTSHNHGTQRTLSTTTQTNLPPSHPRSLHQICTSFLPFSHRQHNVWNLSQQLAIKQHTGRRGAGPPGAAAAAPGPHRTPSPQPQYTTRLESLWSLSRWNYPCRGNLQKERRQLSGSLFAGEWRLLSNYEKSPHGEYRCESRGTRPLHDTQKFSSDAPRFTVVGFCGLSLCFCAPPFDPGGWSSPTPPPLIRPVKIHVQLEAVSSLHFSSHWQNNCGASSSSSSSSSTSSTTTTTTTTKTPQNQKQKTIKKKARRKKEIGGKRKKANLTAEWRLFHSVVTMPEK